MDVTNFLYERGVPVPKILAQDDEGGFLLVEDFGTTTIHDQAQAYMQAIDVLGRMSRIPIQESDMPNYRQSYIYQALRFATDYWFKRPELGDDWLKLWDGILDAQRDWPNVLSHMDCHAGNIMLRDDGSVGFIDHQAAMLAPLGYDFVNLIEDARLDLPPDLKQQAFLHYSQSIDPKYRYKLNDYLAILTSQFHFRVLGQIDRMAVELDRNDMQKYRAQLRLRLQKGLDHPALSRVGCFLKENDITL